MPVVIQDHKEALEIFTRQEQFFELVEEYIRTHVDPITKATVFTTEFGYFEVILGEVWQKTTAAYGTFTLADFQAELTRMAIPFDPATQTVAEFIALQKRCITTFQLNGQALNLAERLDRLFQGLAVGDPLFEGDVTDFKNLNHPLAEATYVLATVFFQTRADVRRAAPTARTTRYAARVEESPPPAAADGHGGGGQVFVSHAAFQAAVYAACHGEHEYAYGAAARPVGKAAPEFYCCSHGLNDSHGSARCNTRPWPGHDDAITMANHKRYFGAAAAERQPPGFWKGRFGRGGGLGAPPAKASGDWRAAAPGRNGGGGCGFGGRGAIGGGGGRGRGRGF
jgi:hypothetical protein